MSRSRYSCIGKTAAVIWLSMTSFFGMAAPVDTEVPYHDGQVNLDGELNETVWQHANEISLDLVNFPYNNTPSPIKTTVKLVENGNELMLAFIAEDPEPEKILAFYGDRDTRWEDDLIGIKLDSQNNRRMSYEFLANPFGIQIDAINNQLTGDKNDLWDGIWHSFGKITESGFVVEMVIPYQTLNFDETPGKKSWALELLRIYPRDNWLRLSHVPLDKNNDCDICQYPTISGFENATTGRNLTLTPSLVASRSETRNIYQPDAQWQSDEDVDAGLDVRWGINANTLLNVTVNPDFSAVEADAGQLNVNETFSLFYDEKRQFFLENSEYFSTPFNLVYTRNIADPDAGLKLTGREGAHTYGGFWVDDQVTNILIPGNRSSNIAVLGESSQAAAFNYRFDSSEDLSIGAIATLRDSDNYHNYVAGIDTRWQINESASVTAQWLSSNTEYPDDLFQQLCWGDDCSMPENVTCTFGNCDYNEQVLRTMKSGDFTDQAFQVTFEHNTEFWDFSLSHQDIGEDFRADLGFINQVDITESEFEVVRNFYSYEGDTFWQEAQVAFEIERKENQAGALIEQGATLFANINGPKQMFVELLFHDVERAGLRHDESSLAIDDNADLFDLNFVQLYAEFKPSLTTYFNIFASVGDQVDYQNNRLADGVFVESSFSWFITPHLEFAVTSISETLDAENKEVFNAQLYDTRITYQFDAQSYIKVSAVYSDVDNNLDNNPIAYVDDRVKELSTQVLYGYKINPQTVFFLGYSDVSYEDDALSSLERSEKTFFTKISYAWMP